MTIERVKKIKVTTKVALNINFSAPRLVKEEELLDLPKDVPLTCIRINTVIRIANIP